MPALALIPSDGPSEQQLAEIEAGIRAGIVADYLTAVRTGNVLDQLSAEYLAARIDESTPDGPRLLDELADLTQPAAA
ncbi:hypothetical protein GCM10010275_30250 [Streptomyces litmocidini]|uniref:hypothetical protein n=1 Tax=Streptomyces litmocidini TaxID=67318 RepID=UPI00167EA906|nr:hypothetical protein [Streptomyces litmocidini]GGU91124.1 hypothetical protein GCM10010275_30250 [Streptomyces litmocidini]